MSDLLQLQRRMAEAVMTPLTGQDGMRKRTALGSMEQEAGAYIKPNAHLESFERLEIYNRQYWFRVLDSLAEDFPGLQAIVGAKCFHALSIRYITDCPSTSFTLRNLGSQMSTWLEANPEWLQPAPDLIRDMVRIEWAHIEVFDAAERPALSSEQLASAGEDLQLALQPHIRLLHLQHPVDDLLLAVRKKTTRKISPAGIKRVAPQPTFLAVHRADYSVHYKRLDAEEFLVLSKIQQGAPLPEALESAFENSALPESLQAQKVQQWFALWMSLGWFCQLQ